MIEYQALVSSAPRNEPIDPAVRDSVRCLYVHTLAQRRDRSQDARKKGRLGYQSFFFFGASRSLSRPSQPPRHLASLPFLIHASFVRGPIQSNSPSSRPQTGRRRHASDSPVHPPSLDAFRPDVGQWQRSTPHTRLCTSRCPSCAHHCARDFALGPPDLQGYAEEGGTAHNKAQARPPADAQVADFGLVRSAGSDSRCRSGAFARLGSARSIKQHKHDGSSCLVILV